MIKKPIKLFAKSWFKEVKRAFEPSMKGAGYIKKNWQCFKTNVRSIQSKNKVKNGPDMSDFNNVLAHWGIETHEIDQVINGLKVQRFVYGIIGIIGFLVAFFSAGLWVFSQGIMLILLGVSVIIFRTWRISVIQNRKFIYFKDWVLKGD